MRDPIERQAAINAVKKNTFRLTFAEEQGCEGHVAWSANAVYSDVMEGALLELPSAAPERKTGHWKQVDPIIELMSPKGWMPWYCSECGCGAGKHQTAFCPNCGADMRGGREE